MGFQEVLGKRLVHCGTNYVQKGRKEILEAKLTLWGKKLQIINVL